MRHRSPFSLSIETDNVIARAISNEYRSSSRYESTGRVRTIQKASVQRWCCRYEEMTCVLDFASCRTIRCIFPSRVTWYAHSYTCSCLNTSHTRTFYKTRSLIHKYSIIHFVARTSLYLGNDRRRGNNSALATTKGVLFMGTSLHKYDITGHGILTSAMTCTD